MRATYIKYIPGEMKLNFFTPEAKFDDETRAAFREELDRLREVLRLITGNPLEGKNILKVLDEVMTLDGMQDVVIGDSNG